MGRLTDLFAGRTLEAILRRARHKMANGDLVEAMRVVEAGQERYPDTDSLRDLHLTIRRVQARAAILNLKRRITMRDPLAYEQLIKLYQSVSMEGEALRTAMEYAEGHPEHDSPHLLLGEMHLQSFFEDLLARDAHKAHDHLLRAARLNAQAIKPRLLLAELYYCVGAHRALAVVGRALESIDPDDEGILPVLETIASSGNGDTSESVDGLFAKAEVDGQLLREPTTWPLRNRLNRDAQVQEEQTTRLVERMVKNGEAQEVVILRRNGSCMVHASLDDPSAGDLPRADKTGAVHIEDSAEPEDDASGLVHVVRTVARTISQQAREFDLGGFKRCTIQGSFGLVVVGRVSNVIAGFRRTTRTEEPLRVWEKAAVKLQSVSQGSAQ